MSLADQMRLVDELVRHPDRLAELIEAGGEDAQVLATIDPDRLRAVSENHARHVLGRWWEPRFGATLGGVADVGGLAVELVRSAWFERADGEDVRATALVNGLLDALEAGRAEAAPWTVELLAYEYALGVGLPRRARGEPIDEATEARLLEGIGLFLGGGRLARPVLLATFYWPVDQLREHGEAAAPESRVPKEASDGTDELEPRTWLLFAEGETVAEVETSEATADALQLLAEGAADAVLAEALGDEAEPMIRWLRDLGVIVE